MPTAVPTAKQCLTPQASLALEEAVSVARRRGHAQTTSLHAVSAFLSQPSSPLREACIRARNASFYPRVQFKALEFSLSLSLDRLPTNSNHQQQHQPLDEPPISNSLMAAIKRSQANQRRQPDSFSIKQHQQGVEQVGGGSGIGTSGIKVELEHLIVSILDDPIVSRVFNEAGFSSLDIKLAIVRPVHSFFRYPRLIRRPPNMFFGNLDEISDSGCVPFRFPFSGSWRNSDTDDDLSRIGRTLMKKKGRNPLLIGVSSPDELRVFIETVVEHKKDNVLLPSELHGIHVIRFEKEILEIVHENRSEEMISSMFEHVGMVVKQCLGPGVMVSLGDLKSFLGGTADDDGVVVVVDDDVLKCVVKCLTKLLVVHGTRIWVIAAATHETYLKFVTKFPSVEMDWDLQFLPISSIMPAMAAESCFKSSLMGSFIPFGGFFSSPSDAAVPLISSNQSARRCDLYNRKCEPKFTAAGFGSSVADQYQTILPSWLRMSEQSPNNRSDVLKAKDDKLMAPTAVAGVQRNWDTICQQLHHSQSSPGMKLCRVSSGGEAAMGCQFSKLQAEMSDDWGNCSSKSSRKESDDIRVDPALSINSYQHSVGGSILPSRPIPKNDNFLGKLLERPAKAGLAFPGPRNSPICSLPLSSVDDNQASPTSGSTVTTDLGLGMFSPSTGQDEKKGTCSNTRESQQDYSGCCFADSNIDKKFSDNLARFSNCSKPEINRQSDLGNLKALFETLIGRIGRQNKAIRLISQTVARCRSPNGRHHASVFRGDMWLYFLGPDASGKRKIATALAEILYGGRDKFIHVDLREEDWKVQNKRGSDQGAMKGCADPCGFHSKTVVDCIAWELSKTPLSVVLLENVHHADPLVQNSLLQAIRSGKFSDSYGKEVSISNATFVLSSRSIKNNATLDILGNPSSLSEERIMKARGWPIQIIVKDLTVDHKDDHNFAVVTAKKGTPDPFFLNKRKLKGTEDGASDTELVKRPYKGTNVCLDLNLPAEGIEAGDTDTGSIEEESISWNSTSWLDDLLGLVDETVVFEPFDYVTLAEEVSKLLMESFCKIFSSQSVLEIDPRVMDQITAAAALSEQKYEVADWVEQVLSKGFLEARKRYFLAAHSLVKLDTCQPLYVEDQAQGSYLPSRIILN